MQPLTPGASRANVLRSSLEGGRSKQTVAIERLVAEVERSHRAESAARQAAADAVAAQQAEVEASATAVAELEAALASERRHARRSLRAADAARSSLTVRSSVDGGVLRSTLGDVEAEVALAREELQRARSEAKAWQRRHGVAEAARLSGGASAAAGASPAGGKVAVARELDERVAQLEAQLETVSAEAEAARRRGEESAASARREAEQTVDAAQERSRVERHQARREASSVKAHGMHRRTIGPALPTLKTLDQSELRLGTQLNRRVDLGDPRTRLEPDG